MDCRYGIGLVNYCSRTQVRSSCGTDGYASSRNGYGATENTPNGNASKP